MSHLLLTTPPTSSAYSFAGTSPALYLKFTRATTCISIFSRSKTSKLTLNSPPSSLTQRQCAAKMEVETSSSTSGFVGADDLLIVGPGVLGRLIAQKWRQDHQGCQITGQTFTTDHHDDLVKMGITPSLKGMKASQKYPYVVFCAPPSRTPDYPGDVREASLNWNGHGSFLFTSSSAPYDCYDNGPCDEDSPVVPIGRSPRTDLLLNTEKVVIECGGNVLRLAGLYKADRGAHVYWLRKGTVESRPDHIVNLIHYEDAASLAVAILKKKVRGQTFLGCDNYPLSRHEVMDIVERSGKFSTKFVGFTGTNDPLGKKLNNSKTRQETGWEPKYPSFTQFWEMSE
ncbi:uncharacterized protein LOC108226094 [Daucus carota subsp. sativus]|uniref:uncharacterized protein LOC108226094 n=1 Tax=Daucus carota subsp. sativus TaxID=79200 RepID=UPI0007EFF6F6|nr:PREDICTED: uncharacterized protein LOC108226094 [Daucus carota subsp. sativus]